MLFVKQGKLLKQRFVIQAIFDDPSRTKYDLNYYKNLAKNLEARVRIFLAIKDMAGLLKPEAAYRLFQN